MVLVPIKVQILGWNVHLRVASSRMLTRPVYFGLKLFDANKNIRYKVGKPQTGPGYFFHFLDGSFRGNYGGDLLL
jgi:hypothetical protein